MRAALGITEKEARMAAQSLQRFAIRSRAALVVGSAVLALIGTSGSTVAQNAEDWTAYTTADLNLRKGPGSGDALFAIIPAGARVQRINGTIVNDYAPVTYNGITGWVIDTGLIATPDAVAPADTSDSGSGSLELFDADARVTLTPLMLRSGPDIEAAPVTGMPEGSLVTLTREGYENGYVTIDFDGVQGWAYADLLGEPDQGKG
jgi:uncharacterized protein YraI